MRPLWAIMPYLNCPDLTFNAVKDVLAQTIPVRLLLIDQGSELKVREEIDALACDTRVYLWHHQPPLPSLAATWNAALQVVWESGGTEALVVNNDVRLNPQTYELLLQAQKTFRTLFVSACGVTAEQFAATQRPGACVGDLTQHGGPDFSCFLITRECHQAYPFDEGFIPAYCEDLDYHRRLMLGGDGARIFSVNLPFEHVGSGTLKGMELSQRFRKEAQIAAGSRTHYRHKWGGEVNQERYTRPFDPTSERDGVTTPELQAAVAAGATV